MSTPRVYIHFHPFLYNELLKRVFRSTSSVEVVEPTYLNRTSGEKKENGERPVDVIVLPIDDQGHPEVETLPDLLAATKLVAISPQGDYGLRRLPGENQWEEFRPSGLAQLIREVVVEAPVPAD